MMTTNSHLGQLLIAIPNTAHSAYARGVMLVTSEWRKGSSMLQINKPMSNGITLNKVMQASGMFTSENTEPVFEGGPDEPARIQIIHSMDWQCSGTRQLNEEIGITMETSILAAIASGDGPEYYRAVAGHRLLNNMPDHPPSLEGELSGQFPWEPGHRWLTLPATMENTFSELGERQWIRCIEQHTKQAVSQFF